MHMQRIDLGRPASGQPTALFGTAATQRIEQTCADALPPHTLMQRAGLATARLARALAPHARTMWIACGPGNNGGDGLEAAMHLQRQGLQVVVSWLGTPESAPADAHLSWQRACAAGVCWSDHAPEGMTAADLCIDALLGLGLLPGQDRPAPASNSPLLALLQQLRSSPAPVLAVDLPSGLQADTGQFAPGFAPHDCADPLPPHPPKTQHTLSLLTLKPGLFTGAGRDAMGSVWFDGLGCSPGGETPTAWLANPSPATPRPHASHKGSYGDVAVVGGEGLQARGMGMAGAALLAARAALHSGAGRVLVALLDQGALELDAQQPELMLRSFEALALEQLTVVCGCGGGDAVRPLLAPVLQRAAQLVLDADALNAIADSAPLQQALQERSQRGQPTVLTPHPLEAARLLGYTGASEVQADRLSGANALAKRFGCVVVLKGSGSVVAAPGQAPSINPTGNALLATAGTGDVLAGMVGAHLAACASAAQAARAAVFAHGRVADLWNEGQSLTASVLVQRLALQ